MDKLTVVTSSGTCALLGFSIANGEKQVTVSTTMGAPICFERSRRPRTCEALENLMAVMREESFEQ